jgi:hypothetical protein
MQFRQFVANQRFRLGTRPTFDLLFPSNGSAELVKFFHMHQRDWPTMHRVHPSAAIVVLNQPNCDVCGASHVQSRINAAHDVDEVHSGSVRDWIEGTRRFRRNCTQMLLFFRAACEQWPGHERAGEACQTPNGVFRLACWSWLAQDTIRLTLASLASRMVEAGGFAPPSEDVRPMACYVA